MSDQNILKSKFQFELSVAEAQLIINHLSEGSWKEVNSLMARLIQETRVEVAKAQREEMSVKSELSNEDTQTEG